MVPRRPEDIHAAFADAMKTRDAARVASLYETEAVLVSQPGRTLHGQDAIRDSLAGFMATEPVFTLLASQVITNGEVALLYSRWRLESRLPGGERSTVEIQPTQVARRQPDGSWRVALDNPAGAPHPAGR